MKYFYHFPKHNELHYGQIPLKKPTSEVIVSSMSIRKGANKTILLSCTHNFQIDIVSHHFGDVLAARLDINPSSPLLKMFTDCCRTYSFKIRMFSSTYVYLFLSCKVYNNAIIVIE